jgi:hypothetical protein
LGILIKHPNLLPQEVTQTPLFVCSAIHNDKINEPM